MWLQSLGLYFGVGMLLDGGVIIFDDRNIYLCPVIQGLERNKKERAGAR
jgi:hypothetical protein